MQRESKLSIYVYCTYTVRHTCKRYGFRYAGTSGVVAGFHRNSITPIVSQVKESITLRCWKCSAVD